MENKPSFITFGLSLILAWLVSTTLDELSPNLNLFVHVIIVALVSAFIWRFISVAYFVFVRNRQFMKKHEEEIDQMIEDGMSVEEITKRLEAIYRAERAEIDHPTIQQDTNELAKKTIKVIAATKICGYYKDKPIYEKIKLSTGEIFEFDGIFDTSKKTKPTGLDPSSIILESGLIYKLEK